MKITGFLTFPLRQQFLLKNPGFFDILGFFLKITGFFCKKKHRFFNLFSCKKKPGIFLRQPYKRTLALGELIVLSVVEEKGAQDIGNKYVRGIQDNVRGVFRLHVGARMAFS